MCPWKCKWKIPAFFTYEAKDSRHVQQKLSPCPEAQGGPDGFVQWFVLKGVLKGWILLLWQVLAFSYCWWTVEQWEERNALSVWDNPKCSHPGGWRSLPVSPCGSGFCRIIPLRWQREYEVLNSASSLPPSYQLGNTLYAGISRLIDRENETH